MNLSFYSAAIGASMQMKHMDVTGNNISHVNTYGYKAEVSGFANLMYGYFEGAEEEMSFRGAGTMLVQAPTNHTTGTLVGTDHSLDFAISGDGYFAVYDPATEEITFTRDGSFVLSETTLDQAVNTNENEDDPVLEGDITDKAWRLGDNSGRFVIDQAGNFIDIDPSASMLDHTPESLNIGVFDFAIKDGLLRNGPSGFINVEKNGDVQVGTGEVIQGYLESSNVDLAKEMTKMIEAQRLYSYALKMVTTSDEIETTINGLPS